MKNKNLYLIVGVVIFILILIIGGIYIFNKKNNSTEINFNLNPEDAKDYVGESTTSIHKDFRAIIKSDWQESEISPSIYIYLPKNTNEEDVNAEVISIAVTFLGEENSYTLEEILNQGVENSKQFISDFELTESLDWENNNFIGKKIKFTGTQEGIKRNSVQVFGIAYDNLYTITYSCPINNCNSYAVYNSLIESFEPIKSK
jgi:hypothetical protein